MRLKMQCISLKIAIVVLRLLSYNIAKGAINEKIYGRRLLA